MATFQTSSPEVRDLGIGDQRIVQTGETGIGGIVDSVSSAARVGAQYVENVVVPQKAEEIVSNAMQELDQGIAINLDEVASSDPAVNTVGNLATRLNRAVSRGAVSKDNARLIISNSVVKAIEEQPWLSRQIRSAAANLLGFDPKSEVVRQYFSAFDPQPERKKTFFETEYEKTDAALGSTATPEQKAAITRQRINAQLQADTLKNEMFVRDVSSEELFGGLLNTSNQVITQSIMSKLNEARQNGVDINDPKEIERLLAEQATAGWLALSETLRANPKGAPSSAKMSDYKKQYDQIYTDMSGIIKEIGPRAIIEDKLALMGDLSGIYMHQTFPVMKAFNDHMPRVAEKVFEVLQNAGNSPKQQALLATNPFLKPFVDIATSPEDFKQKVYGSLKKFADAGAGQQVELTTEDKALGNHLLSKVVPQLPPEERKSALDSLYKAGMNTGVYKNITTRLPTASTPEEIKLAKQEWANIQATVPNRIGSFITSERTGATPRNMRVRLDDSGKMLILEERQMTPAGISWVSVENSDMQKLNRSLTAVDKYGWSSEFKVNDVKAKAKEFLSQITGVDVAAREQRLKELRAKKAAAGK